MQTYQGKAFFISFQAFFMINMALLFLVTGSIEALYITLVLLLLSLPVKILKSSMLRIAPNISARPAGAGDCHAFPGAFTASKTGMPSGHSAGAFTMMIYTLYYIWYVHNVDSVVVLKQTQQILSSVVVVFIGIGIAYSRILYQCHTWKQIFAGAILGVLWSILSIWFRPQAMASLSSLVAVSI